MEYKSIREMADEWGISKRRIQVLCSENRIEGAVRIGYLWAIQANAKGFVSTGGFTVLSGSKISDHTVPSLETQGKGYYNLRNTLIKDEVIKDGVFQKDYEFSAPSAASAVILGHTSNGNVDWKTENGTKLKDL